MSSRIVAPEEQREIGPVVWRQVGNAAAPAAAPPQPTPEPPNAVSERAQMEAMYQQKVRDAHAAGVREGEIAGRNRAAEEIRQVMERLTRTIQEVTNLKARLRHEAEADVVKLALAIARRVIRREVAADPDALRGLVKAALEKLQGQEISRVRVHPAHVDMVKAGLRQTASGGSLEVLADPSRELGSVIFETERGNLDASVESQLAEIERGLTDRLRKQI